MLFLFHIPILFCFKFVLGFIPVVCDSMKVQIGLSTPIEFSVVCHIFLATVLAKCLHLISGSIPQHQSDKLDVDIESLSDLVLLRPIYFFVVCFLFSTCQLLKLYNSTIALALNYTLAGKMFLLHDESVVFSSQFQESKFSISRMFNRGISGNVIFTKLI